MDKKKEYFFEEKTQQYTCYNCGRIHSTRELCPDIERKLNKMLDYPEGTFLMGNIYLMCLEKRVNFYKILEELTAIVDVSQMYNLDSKLGLLPTDWVAEYFAFSLQCSGKDFYMNKAYTVKKYEQKLAYLNPVRDVDDDLESVIDANGNLLEVAIPINPNFFEKKDPFLDEIDEYSYRDGPNRLYLVRRKNGDILRYSVEMQYRYKFMISKLTKRWVFSAKINSLDQFYANAITLFHTESGVLKEVFEKIMDAYWMEEELVQYVAYDHPDLTRWIDKLIAATERSIANIRWKKWDYSFSLEGKGVNYFCTYGKIDIIVQVNLDENPWIDKEQIFIRDREGLSLCFGRQVPQSHRQKNNVGKFVPASSSEIQRLVKVIEKSISKWGEDSPKEVSEEKKLNFSDVIVISSSQNCQRRSHTVVPITGIVELLTESEEVVEHKVYLGFCPHCKAYTMFYSDYYQMLEKGKPLCKVYYLEDESKWPEISRFDYRSQSTLAAMGYSVSQTSDLSEEERREILDKAIQKNTVQVHDLLDFLNWLVRTRETQDKYKRAVKRWNDDIVYVKETYGENGEKVRVASITVKKRGTDA